MKKKASNARIEGGSGNQTYTWQIPSGGHFYPCTFEVNSSNTIQKQYEGGITEIELDLEPISKAHKDLLQKFVEAVDEHLQFLVNSESKAWELIKEQHQKTLIRDSTLELFSDIPADFVSLRSGFIALAGFIQSKYTFNNILKFDENDSVGLNKKHQTEYEKEIDKLVEVIDAHNNSLRFDKNLNSLKSNNVVQSIKINGLKNEDTFTIRNVKLINEILEDLGRELNQRLINSRDTTQLANMIELSIQFENKVAVALFKVLNDIIPGLQNTPSREKLRTITSIFEAIGLPLYNRQKELHHYEHDREAIISLLKQWILRSTGGTS